MRGQGGSPLTKDPSSRRATIILFGLCLIAASAIAGAAAYRYLFWGDQLPGGFAVSAVDVDGEGSPEYLAAKTLVDSPKPGAYPAAGVLENPAPGAAIRRPPGRVRM